MEFISKLLFWVANSLLIPDILFLLALFARSLILLWSFYRTLKARRAFDRTYGARFEQLTLAEFREMDDHSLFTKYLRRILDPRGDAEYQICSLENEADKELSLSKMLAKMGPVLGLIGTLIAMSPALVGLSSGDISAMAYNMQVVFATTVVGLVISSVGLTTLQVKQRWFARDIYRLEYVTRLISQENAR